MAKDNLKVVVKELRGHHLLNLFYSYIEKGEFVQELVYWGLNKYSRSVKFVYSDEMLITDTIDDMCLLCRAYPAINFCKGLDLKLEDHKSVDMLGVVINHAYAPSELECMFKEKVNELGLKIGSASYVLEKQLKKFL